MADQLKPAPQELSSSTQHVTTELLPGLGLNIEAEQARLKHWEETGEYTAPTPIARLTLSPEAIAFLETQVPKEFQQYINHGSEEKPKLVPDDDYSEVADADSLAIMNEIEAAFIAIVRKDMEAAEADCLELWNPQMNIGWFDELSYPHVDNPEQSDIRYIVTLTGPNTVFISSKVPKGAVDPVLGQLKIDMPEMEMFDPQPTGTVERFTSDGNLHDVPEVEDPVFRIICDATVMVDREPMDSTQAHVIA